MPNRPPTPVTPIAAPTVGTATATRSDPAIDAESTDNTLLLTTTQLARSIENIVGTCPPESTLEDLLFESDRSGYVTWVGTTQSGTSVWNFGDSPDRIADAVVTAVLARLKARL